MDELDITHMDIECAKRAIDEWHKDPWTRIRMAIDFTESSINMPTITKYKECFPCCTKAGTTLENGYTLAKLLHFSSFEHTCWRHGLSPERFKKAEQCLKVMQVLSDG